MPDEFADEVEGLEAAPATRPIVSSFSMASPPLLDELEREAPVTRWCSCSGRGGDPEPPPAAATRRRRPVTQPRCCLFTAGSPARRSSTASSGRRPPGLSRRIALATNVAATSLTVPGSRYVDDRGPPGSVGTACARRCSDCRGQRQPAKRTQRPNQSRHRDPALLRGRLPEPPGVHRAGDPAGDPADDRAGGSAMWRSSRSCSRRIPAASRTGWSCDRTRRVSKAPQAVRRSPNGAERGGGSTPAPSPASRSCRLSALRPDGDRVLGRTTPPAR